MHAPIEAVARFIATGDEHCLGVFADEGVTILENFAPFLFTGPGAVGRWAEAMRAHTEPLTGLAHRFGSACDLRMDEDRVFFTLPTHWSGAADGRRFAEDGGWAVLIVRQAGAWRLLGYGWAVTHLVFADAAAPLP